MGKVLILCAGEQERWGLSMPRQCVEVYDDEELLARTVRQIRKRMNNYPHIISHQKYLRSYSTNYVVPSTHRWLCDTLNSVSLIWGNDWTMVLLGDVLYSDKLMDTIYAQRDKFKFHFYGTSSDILAMTFTDNIAVKDAVMEVNCNCAENNTVKGKLWDLYHCLWKNPVPGAGRGYIGEGGADDLHYTYTLDDSRDFDSLEDYSEWRKNNGT